MLDKIESKLSGRKTYILGGVVIALGVLQALDIFVMPDWGWVVASGLGLEFMRAAVEKVGKGLGKIPDKK